MEKVKLVPVNSMIVSWWLKIKLEIIFVNNLIHIFIVLTHTLVRNVKCGLVTILGKKLNVFLMIMILIMMDMLIFKML